MYAVDFEYDGLRLSDFGLTIGRVDSSSDIDVVSAGSNISFNTVKRHHGKIYGLTSTSYEECITTTFQIFKDPCQYDTLKLTNDEFRELMRWLNRHKFLKFHLIPEDGDNRAICYYYASFNVGKILVDDEVSGLELEMETNRPYGVGETQIYDCVVEDTSEVFSFDDISDDISYTFVNMHIVPSEDGDLTITNQTIGSTTVIKNCRAGEKINIDGDTMIITSSLSSHKICNDFNFEFPRIANTFDNKSNEFTFSLACAVEISYDPVIKDSPE